MRDTTGSLGPFFEGYREKMEKIQMQKRYHTPEATDLLQLFSDFGTKSISLVEIASFLMIPNIQAKRFADELSKRRLVTIKQISKGEYYVELTKRGELYLKE